MQELCGTYTNDTTDLACKILKVYHVYENGDAKVRYALFYKKGSSIIENKTTVLRKIFFDVNHKI